MVTSVSSTFEISLPPELPSWLAEEVARTGSPPNRVVGEALLERMPRSPSMPPNTWERDSISTRSWKRSVSNVWTVAK